MKQFPPRTPTHMKNIALRTKYCNKKFTLPEMKNVLLYDLQYNVNKINYYKQLQNYYW